MGKRSSFERIQGDCYPTPFAAVPPLIPHLRGVRTFAEPCCGDDALVRHLEELELRCVYAGDLVTGHDALAVDSYGPADAIITNPPYERRAMHELIRHFEKIAPTWLLLEMDWAATRQAEPFLPSCSDIVVVGRLKLFEETKHAGKENFAWFRFDHRHSGGPILPSVNLCPRVEASRVGSAARLIDRSGLTRDSVSDACRQRAYRERRSVTKRNA
jgi:hypothetical protein